MSFPRGRESRISMPQEFIGKNQNPSAVIPTKVGIQSSHGRGNLEMKRNRHLSEITETERTGFPLLRE
ncbi:hypothetical protein EZZ76_02025 [Neisseria meningitidis]|nr:hypothetical protein [Neisseria meningitidis]